MMRVAEVLVLLLIFAAGPEGCALSNLWGFVAKKVDEVADATAPGQDNGEGGGGVLGDPGASNPGDDPGNGGGGGGSGGPGTGGSGGFGSGDGDAGDGGAGGSQSPIFVGDFETGDFGDFRLEGNKTAPWVSIVTNPVRNGHYAVKVVVDRLNSPVNHRTEAQNALLPDSDPQASKLTNNRNAQIGSEYWFGFSVYIPSNFVQDGGDPWGDIIAQWHAQPDFALGESWRSPPLMISIKKDHFVVTYRWDADKVNSNTFDGKGEVNVGAVASHIGKWVDWVVDVRWSYQSDGFTKIWKNGVLVYDRTGPNTFNDDKGPYFKFGLYKPWWKSNSSSVNVRTYFVDELRIGNSTASYQLVAPDSYEE